MARKSARASKTGSLLVGLDPRSPEPLHTQIYAGLRRAILDGFIPPGTGLPSSRALAADLHVSRTTTLLAFDQLTAEGYVTGRAGAGTFVSRDLPDEAVGEEPMARTAIAHHPQLSTRGTAIASTPPTAIRAGGAPRPFRIGTPALDAFPVDAWTRIVRHRLQRWPMEQLDYGHAAGLPALREVIAEHVSRSRGTSCVADQVVVVNGAQHGLEFIFRLLLDPGDVAAIEDPGYPGARGALVAAGADIRPVPVDAEGLDVASLRRAARRARLAYVTPSHQFPLGVPMSLPRRLALLAWAQRTGAWIVEDDYDSEFRHGERPIPCLHGLDRSGCVIYVGTFSKTLFPSLRLGFLIVPLDLRDDVVRARRTADIHPASASQAVLADFIGDGHFERHLRRMRREYGARLEALTGAITRHCAGALTLHRVATGLHAVAELQGAEDMAVLEEALTRGVEVMPVSGYYARGATGRSADNRRAATTQPVVNALALGFGAARPERIDAAAETLAAAIDAVRRRHARRRRG